MAKLKYLVIHCTATPEGREVSSADIRKWHTSPVAQGEVVTESFVVFYNEKLKESPDMQTGIEQTLALERGSRIHDDAPDADEGAIWMQMCIRDRPHAPPELPYSELPDTSIFPYLLCLIAAHHYSTGILFLWHSNEIMTVVN